jgi:Flp pilus assembly protein TadB
MWRYGFKLAAAGILLMAAGIVAVIIFEDIWTRVGLGAAIVVVVGGLLFWAWRVDRKDRQARAGIDELPHV